MTRLIQNKRTRRRGPLGILLRSLPTKLATVALIAGFLFIGLKGCVVTIWVSPDEMTTYGAKHPDGRMMAMMFLPENETLITYGGPRDEEVEVVLTKMRGACGTHYVGPLWQIEGPGIWLGWRLYPSDVTPIVLEVEVLETLRSGPGGPVFPAKGETSQAILLFGKDRVRFQNTWLQKLPTDPEFVAALMEELKTEQ